MSRHTGGLLAACMLMLAGCAGQPVRESASHAGTATELQAQAARVTLLQAHPRWSLQGRVAVSNGREGGNGRIEWQQDDERFEVSLSAPITRQSWRLSGDAGSARLDGLEGGPREDHDAEHLLKEATGWVIPVSALSAWLRGIAAPRLPAAALRFGSDGRLSRLRQDGWTIDYVGWQAQPEIGVELPQRLTATRDDAKVRLVIDGWQQGEPSP